MKLVVGWPGSNGKLTRNPEVFGRHSAPIRHFFVLNSLSLTLGRATTCARENPNATRIIVGLMAMYLHLGPFSRRVIAEIDRRIDADVAAPRADRCGRKCADVISV